MSNPVSNYKNLVLRLIQRHSTIFGDHEGTAYPRRAARTHEDCGVRNEGHVGGEQSLARRLDRILFGVL